MSDNFTLSAASSEGSAVPPQQHKQQVQAFLTPEIRGLLGVHGDSISWLNCVSKFPNGVPRFTSKNDCLSFMKEYNTNHGGSNPQYPHLQHIFTLIVGWEQITSILLPAIEKARQEQRHPNAPLSTIPIASQVPTNVASTDSQNVYERSECSPVVDAIEERLNVSFHRCTTVNSTMNTLKYLYHHMKFGIYIKIQNSQLRIFAPFVNLQYQNTWSQHLSIEGDGTLDSYYSQKDGLYREEQIELDKSKWWANGNIIWCVIVIGKIASLIYNPSKYSHTFRLLHRFRAVMNRRKWKIVVRVNIGGIIFYLHYETCWERRVGYDNYPIVNSF
jgi:hypothetical protein